MQEKAIRHFPFLTEVKYKVTRFVSVYADDKGIYAPPLFKVCLGNVVILQNLRKMIEGICDSLDIRDYIQYNFVTDDGFEILDSKGNIRRFIYKLIQIQDRKEFCIKVSEILGQKENDVIKPLKHISGITEDDNNHVESFMKTLELNNIEIQKGKFYDER